MIRNGLSRCRNSRCITFICAASLCINVLLLISTRHIRTDVVKFTIDTDSSVVDSFYSSQNILSNVSNNLPDLLATPSNDTDLKQLVDGPTKEAETKNVDPTMEAKTKHVDCVLCPVEPPKLLGPLADMTEEMNATTLAAVFPSFNSARLQPEGCIARQKTALIIPYRNRYPHLHILLHNLIPFLMRQQADVTFFVIEQAPPETFNRGALLNVGFLEANKIDQFDCYIFHDVDLIPLDDRHLYRCGDNPKHFAVAINKHNFRLPYKGYFGGAVAFSRRQFLDINGCSNVYFGWGGEDDELNDRVYNKGYLINRSPVSIARYDMIKHNRDKGNEANPVRKKILSTARKRQDIEGLNTIKYHVNSIKFETFYVWINVSLNTTEILLNSPQYVLEEMLKAQKPQAKKIPPKTTVTKSPPKAATEKPQLQKNESTLPALQTNRETIMKTEVNATIYDIVKS